jgi:3-hydroxyisobutyrate dehydrogenase
MKIGFIGLGTMGRGMAANLQKAGHELVVNGLARESASQHIENGATWAATPRKSPRLVMSCSRRCRRRWMRRR